MFPARSTVLLAVLAVLSAGARAESAPVPVEVRTLAEVLVDLERSAPAATISSAISSTCSKRFVDSPPGKNSGFASTLSFVPCKCQTSRVVAMNTRPARAGRYCCMEDSTPRSTTHG